MNSAWLIETGTRVIELVTDYANNLPSVHTLADLHEAIETSRERYNGKRPPWEHIPQEWHFSDTGDGASLFFTDALTDKVFVSLFDAIESVYIRIGGDWGDGLVAHINAYSVRIETCNPNVISDPNHIALIELFEEEVFGYKVIPPRFYTQIWWKESKTIH